METRMATVIVITLKYTLTQLPRNDELINVSSTRSSRSRLIVMKQQAITQSILSTLNHDFPSILIIAWKFPELQITNHRTTIRTCNLFMSCLAQDVLLRQVSR